MLILISPAKTLDMDTPSRVDAPTLPHFGEESEKLIKTLKRYPKKKLGDLMHISDALAELNANRYAEWQAEVDETNARPAIQAFRGDVYVGLDADSLGKRDLNYAQKHLRILSGLYGVLRPLDLIQAHRLEMGTSLKTRQGKSLYDFWGDTITQSLNEEMASDKDKLIVNLASNEYFKSVKRPTLDAQLMSPVFRDEKNGKYKVISFFAKKARGAMARHLIQARAKSVEEVLAFDALGHRYDEAESSEGQAVFLRSEKAAQPYLA
jgi:cytoplasmic iron level regulating protein YaaA (DUF328/UPF0246 family)